MKPSIIRTFFAVLTGLSAMSCSLTTDPTAQYTVDTFWSSVSGCEAAMTGCYNALTSKNIFGTGIICEDTATPYMFNYNNQFGFGNILLGSHSSASSGIIRDRWHDCYKGIGRCNMVISRNPESVVTDARKKTIEGEARFLRALFYYMLEAYYGDVPLILDEADYKDASKPRTPRKEVVAAIIDDLDRAVELLDWKASERGRATRGAALALKARVQFFEASPLVNTSNDNQAWEDVANTCATIVNNAAASGYGLFGDYRKLFLPENENSCECIFDVQYSKAPDAPYNEFSMYSVQYRCNSPSLNLVSQFSRKDGAAFVAGDYTNMEERFYATVFYPGCTFLAAKNCPADDVSSYTGFAFKKLTIYDEQARLTGDLKPEQETNYMVLRYADVLLMYAEALNEIDETEKALQYINLVRNRAKMASLPSSMGKDALRDAIHHERIVEFAGEGLLYNELRRLKKAETVMNNAKVLNYNNEMVSMTSFKPERDYWWPVPQYEIGLNKNLRQNPNY